MSFLPEPGPLSLIRNSDQLHLSRNSLQRSQCPRGHSGHQLHLILRCCARSVPGVEASVSTGSLQVDRHGKGAGKWTARCPATLSTSNWHSTRSRNPTPNIGSALNETGVRGCCRVTQPDVGPDMIFTIGHSTKPIAFLAILAAHGIEQLEDVRTAPGSRRNPQYGSDALEAALRQAEIAYIHRGIQAGCADHEPIPRIPDGETNRSEGMQTTCNRTSSWRRSRS